MAAHCGRGASRGCLVLRFFGILAAVLLVSAPALADGWGRHHHRGHRTSVFLGFNFGAPAYYRPYYRPVYYYPPPVYYVPPPPPVYYAPTYYAPAPACRQFSGDATIDGSGRPFYGRACLGAGGLWHIVP